MPASALFALFRDIANLAASAADDVAKLAASAADDIAAQTTKMAGAADDIASLTGQAAAKTVGVAGDDLAVGAGQVSGVSPSRELPVLWRIAKGSALNKAWLSAVLLVLSYYLPVVITAALVCGALYLAYEGGEGLLDRFVPHDDAAAAAAPQTEDEKVKGAVRTDLVLSLEILVISLAAAGDAPLEYKAAVLLGMSVLMTVLVYGVIGIIIRLDDMGLALVKSGAGWRRTLGRKLVNAAPLILKGLEPIGMVAMFAVAGGIFLHLVHIEFSHWVLGLLADMATGLAIGLALAGGHHVLARIARSRAGAARP